MEINYKILKEWLDSSKRLIIRQCGNRTNGYYKNTLIIIHYLVDNTK